MQNVWMQLREAACGALLLCACGGSSSAAVDAGGDHAVDAGPCDPYGAWTLTLAPDGGVPSTEHIAVDASDGGSATVTFLDRAPAVDTCGPPEAGSDAGLAHIVAPAVLDASACTLSAAYTESWCFSGEQQCRDFKLVLAVAGDGATGSATDTGGWCMDQHTATWSVTGVRQ